MYMTVFKGTSVDCLQEERGMGADARDTRKLSPFYFRTRDARPPVKYTAAAVRSSGGLSLAGSDEPIRHMLGVRHYPQRLA